VTEFKDSIIGNPRSWTRPDDVIRREREMKEGIAEFQKQVQQDRAKTQEISKGILGTQPAVLTPPPPEKSKSFGDQYAIYVDGVAVWDAQTRQYVPRGSDNFMWGVDDDGDGA
jgi:hypothetical protein